MGIGGSSAIDNPYRHSFPRPGKRKRRNRVPASSAQRQAGRDYLVKTITVQIVSPKATSCHPPLLRDSSTAAMLSLNERPPQVSPTAMPGGRVFASRASLRLTISFDTSNRSVSISTLSLTLLPGRFEDSGPRKRWGNRSARLVEGANFVGTFFPAMNAWSEL